MGFTRCSFTDNHAINVGGGWGALTRPNRKVATPILLYRVDTDTVDITVTRNVFENVPNGLVFCLEEELPPGYRIFGNTVK